MKITNVETFPVWGGQRNFLFVVVDTDEGISGVGEAGITGRELAEVGAIEHFKPLLIGQDPMRTEHLWQLLFRGGFFPAERILASAISAIDIALWDIKGKALGVPIYELLGGRVRDKVVCYPHNAGHGMEIAPLVESCLQTKEEGWKFVRWGLPNDGELLEPRVAVKAAIAQFQAVREAVGDEIEICFDVHTRLDLPDALWLCREVEPFRPYFIEDPLRSENPDSFKTLRPRTARAAGRRRAVQLEVGVPPADRGGVDRLRPHRPLHRRRLHRGAQDRRLVRDPLHQAGAAQPARAHLQRRLPPAQPRHAQLRRAGAAAPHRHGADRCRAGAARVGGRLPAAADRPGLGIEFDREAARAHPFQMTELPQLRRPDGSFTNW